MDGEDIINGMKDMNRTLAQRAGIYLLDNFFLFVMVGALLVVVLIHSWDIHKLNEKYKKELDWWMNEPMVRVMDMNFTHTADLDIWKMNHAGAKVIKLVELPQKQHYGVYWLPAEKEAQ